MVQKVVDQHHPDDINYSLEDVDTDPTAFSDKLEDPEEDVKMMSYQLPEGQVRVLYEPGTSGTAEDISSELDSDELDEKLESMDQTSRVIAIWLLNFFAEMQEEEKELGNSLSMYKDLEIERVPEAIQHVEWDGSVTDVAGHLMSNLILRHALPNANHRTGVTMAQAYLKASGASFEMPATKTEEYDWRSWVQPYIIESKRILTVRRHNRYFQTLKELGCEVVRRKHDIDIVLKEYDIDMYYHEAWETYAELHEQHCIGFVEDIVARGGNPALITQKALPKEEFIEFLQKGNSE